MENKIYWALREEILCNYEQENNLIQFVYTAVIAALGLAITMEICWLAYIVSFAILPMSLRIADIRYSTAYIATYLKTFLEEPNDKFSWESVHYAFANKYSKISLKNIIYNTCRMDFFILAVISNVLFWFIHGISLISDKVSLTILVLCSQVLIICFEGFIGIKFANLKKMKKDLMLQWEELKNENGI